MNAIDFLTVDPSTLSASVGLDAWIAEKWMEWISWSVGLAGIKGRSSNPLAVGYSPSHWSPSTNPAHALEALLKERFWRVEMGETKLYVTIYDNNGRESAAGECLFSDTNNKGEAMALATVRALVAASQVRQPTK